MIFPAKNLKYEITGIKGHPLLEFAGGEQAKDMYLDDHVIIAASNTGRTKELQNFLENAPFSYKFLITSDPDSPLQDYADPFIMQCGNESATAATKSVIEQGLIYRKILLEAMGENMKEYLMTEMEDQSARVLDLAIDDEIISDCAYADHIYFAGRDNGVAEEAQLKAMEIARQPGGYFAGTTLLHGPEEVLKENDVLIWIDPITEYVDLVKERIEKAKGTSIYAIASKDTMFDTIKLPDVPGYNGYLQLMSCWNLLAKTGLENNQDIDKGTYCRKTGNPLD